MNVSLLRNKLNLTLKLHFDSVHLISIVKANDCWGANTKRS